MNNRLILTLVLFLLYTFPVYAMDKNTPLYKASEYEAPLFYDDSNLADLKKAVESSITYYENVDQSKTFVFGAKKVSAGAMKRSLMSLKRFLSEPKTRNQLNQYVRRNFDIYGSRTIKDGKEVIFSAYYEHTLKASLKKKGKYKYPIYARPTDLVDVHQEEFNSKDKGKRIVGRVENGKLVPYYSREDIDSNGILKGRGLEIAWAEDILDVLFLQIQGSGWIETPDENKTFHIRYAGDNGLKYRSVGLVLINSGAIKKKEFSRDRMIAYLNKVGAKQRQKILNKNPRYIFFEIKSDTHSTRGALHVPLTKERSIASDPHLYPPGAIAWIETKQPIVNKKKKVIGTKPIRRFVLNQDEGGAIKGTHRIDYFVGGGLEAKNMAEKLWYPGKIFFLCPK